MDQANQKVLSAVIPVFNAERYLKEMLESVFASKNQEMEVIAVDDGSTDRSYAVLQKEAEKDSRLRVIHQENAGLTSAVNTGILQSSGRYITFFDDDDKVESDVLDQLPEILEKEKPDILACGCSVDFVEEGWSVKRTLPKMNYAHTVDAVRDFFKNDSFNPHWGKAYRKDILLSEEGQMKGYDAAGDFLLNCRAFSRAETIINLPDILYHYEKRSNETMVTKYIRNSEQELLAKEQALRQMMLALHAGNDPLIDNYMLREYEVYVINLTSEECPLSEGEKAERIQKYILNEKSYASIQNAVPANRLSVIFRKEALKNNPMKLLRKYEQLRWMKDQFGPLYRKFRKLSY